MTIVIGRDENRIFPAEHKGIIEERKRKRRERKREKY